MKNSDISPKEAARIQTLLEYQVLDTLPEVQYEDITFLASLICETPMAMISLSDGYRQWFKSKVGITADEIPREGSFCDHAVRSPNIFLVPDSLQDTRFSEAAMVKGAPNIRFYAGAPIVAPGGHIMGTVCVLDQKPRDLTEKQLKSLEALARQVAAQLENRKANVAIRSQFEQLQHFARKISKQEQSLIQSAKMNSLGDMASGVAHEVNNPLAIIMGYNQIILDLADKNRLEPQKIKELSTRIEITGHRIAKIVSNLRTFAKDGRHDIFNLSRVDEMVAQTLDFCRARFKSHRIQFEVSSIPADVMIECQQVQVSHVLLNLLSNAYDAVLEKDQRWIRLEFADLGEQISLTVKDSGTGIPEEIRDQLMQPFFTTKQVGKGAGLGLSVANGIMQAHGGHLRLDTTCANTSFVATFPKLQNQGAKKAS